MLKDKKEPLIFPSCRTGAVCATPKGENTVIPDNFTITICKPSKRGRSKIDVTRPGKAGRIITWDIAEANAPDANLSYDEQEAKRHKVVTRISLEEAYRRDMSDAIAKLKKENSTLISE